LKQRPQKKADAENHLYLKHKFSIAAAGPAEVYTRRDVTEKVRKNTI
jgi:hypothetical protein